MSDFNTEKTNAQNHAPETLNVNDQPSKPQPTPLLHRLCLRLRARLRPHLDAYLDRLALPAAFLTGAAIFAGTTYALVRHVQHLVSTASVSNDPAYWSQIARQQAYDGCYLGCDDCDDPSYAWNACQRTAQVNVSGLVCAGALMWNWADRYPPPCLDAVGALYKADALAGLKNHYRKQYAIVLVTLLAGLLGGWLTWCLWRACARHRRHRINRTQAWIGGNNNDNTWQSPSRNAAATTTTTTKKQQNLQQQRQQKARGFFGLAALTALCSRRAAAFPCTGFDAKADTYLVSADGAVAARAHAWLSNCYKYSCNCWTTCSSCGCTSNGCSTCCDTSCETCTASNRAPAQYLADVLPKIEACGFTVASGAPAGETIGIRVANPGIERTWWARIDVSGLNVTGKGRTDQSVQCLHDIGNLSK